MKPELEEIVRKILAEIDGGNEFSIVQKFSNDDVTLKHRRSGRRIPCFVVSEDNWEDRKIDEAGINEMLRRTIANFNIQK